MAEVYKGTKRQHCTFYQKMQRSAKDSFLCVGGGFWDRCADYAVCRLLEIRFGEPKPYVPNKS